VIDVVAAQQVLADLVLDDDARNEWESDPTAYARSRLGPAEAAMIAGLDPVGIRAMAQSHAVKKERFDFLHQVHHAYEDAKAERAGHAHEHGPDGHTHEHGADGHTHDGHTHEHGADGHTHEHGADGHTHPGASS
jgi:hypothetical protein